MTPAKGDLQNRRPVWLALSDLFLDTELQEDELRFIARTLAESPYTLSEIESILDREVYPVCIPNMLCVAGEWAGFDPEALESAILRHMARQESWKRFFQPHRWLWHRWMIDDDWQRVQEMSLEQTGG